MKKGGRSRNEKDMKKEVVGSWDEWKNKKGRKGMRRNEKKEGRRRVKGKRQEKSK